MNQHRILFIGNSFTNRNDLPGILTALGAAADPQHGFETRRIIANGMSLKAHWNRATARETINREPWDYVVLQEQSTLPLKNRERMHESITLFDEAIRARAARTVLYMTWARLNAFDRQDELADAYISIGLRLGALIAPVGAAWQEALKADPDLRLHDRDGSHPNAAGSYLAACVFFSTLTRQSPIGLAAGGAEKPVMEEILADRLQKAAWHTVQAFWKKTPGSSQ